MTVSTYLGNAILDLALRGVAFVPPSAVYLSLHTGDPGAAGDNELTVSAWPSYARKETSDGAGIASGFAAANAKQTQNTKQLLFEPFDGAASKVITHFGLWDAAAGGNFLFGAALAAARQFDPSDEALFYPGRLVISVE